MTNWRNFFVLSQGHKSNKKQTNLQNTLGSELEHSFCVGIILFFSIEVFKYFSVGYIKRAHAIIWMVIIFAGSKGKVLQIT